MTLKRFKEKLSGLLRLFPFRKKALFCVNKPVKSRLSIKALEYLKIHFKDDGLNLNRTAKDLRVTPDHLGKTFKRDMKLKYMDHLNQLRIGHAVELLKKNHRNGQNISEIGYECGFVSYSSFERLFKKFMGRTPSEYMASN